MELHDNEATLQQEVTASTLNVTDVDTTKNQNSESATPRNELTIGQLLDALKEIAESDCDEVNADEIARLKQQFYYLQHKNPTAQNTEETPEQSTESDSSDEQTFKTLMSVIKEKRAEARAKAEAAQTENLRRKNEIIEEIKAISNDTDNVNLHHPRIKELQAEFRTIGEIPQQYATENWKAYQDAVEHFYDQWKVNKELRDYDFKKNLSEKQLLIDEASKLTQDPDIVVAFRRLQDLHDKWRQIGPVAKDFREDIWTKFKDISAIINKNYQAYFEDRKKKELENENAKIALCEKIEAIDMTELSTFAQWNEATHIIIDAQEQWKKLGFASRKTNNTLFQRFRKRCDDFFSAKSTFFANVKDQLNKNLQAKTAICEEAEALKDSTDWKKTADRLTQLQNDWKKIGAVPKKQSDPVWNRFMAACEHFFSRRKADASATRKTEQTNLSTKRAIIDELTSLNQPEANEDRQTAINRINELRKLWQETGHVPFKEKDKLHDTYREVVRQLFEKYDINQTRARKANFEANLDNIASDPTKLSRERERLIRAYDARCNQLSNYETNLGFFNAQSKSGNSMLREIQNNIQRLKKDIADLQTKIDMIDARR